MNPLFEEYVLNQKIAFEIVPWCFYDTQILRPSDSMVELSFFNQPMNGIGSNMYCPGILPNPMAFLIESIKIHGISSSTALGQFTLQIGNKDWQRTPAWLMSVQPKWKLCSGLMIGPLVYFRAFLRWDELKSLGKGLSGRNIEARPIQVALIGYLARAIH